MLTEQASAMYTLEVLDEAVKERQHNQTHRLNR